MHIHTGKLKDCYRAQLNALSRGSSEWKQLQLCYPKTADDKVMTGHARFFYTTGGPSTIQPFEKMINACPKIFSNSQKCSLVLAGDPQKKEGFYLVVFTKFSYTEQFIV